MRLLYTFILLSLLFVSPIIGVYAASLVTDSFDDESKISSLNSLVVSGGQVQLDTYEVDDAATSNVLKLPLDEGEGVTAYDQSEYGNDGTIYGASWVDGKYGKAMSFDGVDDYLLVQKSSSINNLSQFTFAVWLNPMAVLAAERVFDKGAKLLSRVGIWRLSCLIYAATTNALAETNEALTMDAFNFVTMTYDDAGDRKIYVAINGVPCTYVDQIAAEGSLANDNTRNLYIGNREALNRPFQGITDEVRIYNRALTAVEIKRLYETDIMMTR